MDSELAKSVLTLRLERKRQAIKELVTELEDLENGKRVLEAQLNCSHEGASETIKRFYCPSCKLGF